MITPVWIIGFTGHRPSDELGRTAKELKQSSPILHSEVHFTHQLDMMDW